MNFTAYMSKAGLTDRQRENALKAAGINPNPDSWVVNGEWDLELLDRVDSVLAAAEKAKFEKRAR